MPFKIACAETRYAIMASLALKLLLFLVIWQFGHSTWYQAADSGKYIQLAENLVDHHSFHYHLDDAGPIPETLRTPGFPFVLALFYALFGKSYAVFGILQALVCLALIPVIKLFYESLCRHIDFWRCL